MNIFYAQFRLIAFTLFFLVFLPLLILYLWRAEQRRTTTKQEKLMRVGAFVLAVMLGVALYTQSFFLPQHPEPLDINNGFFYRYLSCCAGFVLGYLFPKYLATGYLGTWLGQIIGAILSNQSPEHQIEFLLSPIGIIAISIYNYRILACAVIGKGVRIAVVLIYNRLTGRNKKCDMINL